ncbi:hypothetical protein KO361_02190 [Candidatus Woesearchaeota archaeon]|nr:hypothetical protein [Candidatus Woesearchaeota archaeon]
MVLGFVNDWYVSFLNKFSFLKKAKAYRVAEFVEASDRINSRYRGYLDQLVLLENKVKVEESNLEYLKKSVNKRYWSNICRFFSGGNLLQDVEDRSGLKYFFDKFPGLVVVDKDKYEVVKSEMDKVLGKYEVHDFLKKTVKSKKRKVVSGSVSASSIDSYVDDSLIERDDFVNGSYKFSASHIKDYRSDCYTNLIADISSDNSGSVKCVADVLASYVKDSSNKLVGAPHARSWKSRVSNLEKVISNKNFNSKDISSLRKIKSALSRNSYLVNKRKDLYEKAVSLIDSVAERDVVGAS